MSVDLQMPVRGLPTAIQGSEHWSAPNLRELPVDEAAEVRLHYASSEQIVQPSYPRQSEFSSQAPNLIGRVARLLCGEPNIGLSRWGDLRFGSSRLPFRQRPEGHVLRSRGERGRRPPRLH